MQSSADTSQQRKFALGTWPLSAAIAILISITASVSMQWRIGSPQLLVITIASLLLAALFISVYRSRGRFRLHALLVLMTLVGVGAATIGRRIVFVEKHRGLVRMIAERNGRVIVWGASGQELDGWRMIQGGYVIPSWLHPLYDYFANIRVGRITIPADMLTTQNLELLPFDDELWNSEVILEGTRREPDALLKYSTYHKREPVCVLAKHLTEADVQYLSVLKGKQLHLTLASPNLEDIKRLKKVDASSLAIRDLDVDVVDLPALDSEAEWEIRDRRLSISDSILSGEAIASIGVRWNVQTLEIANSNFTQGAFDELAKSTKVYHLMITGCKVNDADVLALSRNDRIENLRLVGTQITDKGLEALASMKNLKHVDITGSKCTWPGIQKLCRSLELDSINTDVSKQPTGPTGLLPQPVLYWGEMIRESILEEGPAEKPADE